MKKKNNVFVEKPQHLKNVKRESEYKEEKQSYESIWGKVLDLLSWAGFGIFVLWALSLLAAGNPVSAIITAVFAFFISPLRKKVFERLNIRLAAKKTAFIGCFLFLSSCGTFMGLTEVEETVDDSQQMVVVETIEEESSPEKVLFTESETEPVEAYSETITEEIVVSTFEDVPPYSISVEKEIAEETSLLAKDEEPVVPEMQVHFIDVGQGDATLVTCDDEAMLIDAGDNSKGTTVQLYLKKQGISKLKYLILTHPDADHIGGADVIVTKFDIETVFMSDYTKDNKTYDELIRALEGKNLKWNAPNVGNTYALGTAEFTIIAPNTTYSDPNNSSIGLVLRNGENTFLFTGDAEEEAEYDILANGLDIDCDVYKAGHHGSKTASTKELLQAATPSWVIISCAEDNSYGHPHAEPMNNFRSMNMKLFRTDEQGSIIATSDGTEITWNSAPSDSWQAGENTQSSSGTGTSKSEAAESQNDNTAEPEPQPEPQPQPEPEPQPESEPQPTPDPDAGINKSTLQK